MPPQSGRRWVRCWPGRFQNPPAANSFPPHGTLASGGIDLPSGALGDAGAGAKQKDIEAGSTVRLIEQPRHEIAAGHALWNRLAKEPGRHHQRHAVDQHQAGVLIGHSQRGMTARAARCD